MFKARRFSTVFLLVIAIMITVGFSSDKNSSFESPEEALKNLLHMLIQKDYDSYADHVIDFRYPTKEEQVMGYEELKPLESFKILGSNEISQDQTEFSMRFGYGDGEISETKVFMKKVDDEWKIYVKDLSGDDFKLVREGIETASDSDGDNSLNEIVWCGYSFTDIYSGGWHYTNCTFSAPVSGMILSLSNQRIDSGSTPINPRVIYSVVKRSHYNEHVYGSTTVYGSYVSSQRYSLNIGNGKGQSGLSIRVNPRSDGSSPSRWSGRGVLEY